MSAEDVKANFLDVSICFPGPGKNQRADVITPLSIYYVSFIAF